MESTFRFFRVRGIPVGAHWSWLLVFALVVWSLSASLFTAAARCLVVRLLCRRPAADDLHAVALFVRIGDLTMGLTETLIFYLLIGIAVAVAEFISDSSNERGRRVFRTSTALLFWPLYLPIILAGSKPEPASLMNMPNGAADDMERAIAQVDDELDAALSSLDGWAEDVLAREMDRIHELRNAWNAQAARIREMDRLLIEPQAQDDPSCSSRAGPEPDSSTDRWHYSALARQKNMERLRRVRRQAYDDKRSFASQIWSAAIHRRFGAFSD